MRTSATVPGNAGEQPRCKRFALLFRSGIMAIAATAGLGTAAVEDAPAPGSTLTTALQVHLLPASIAQRAYPVQLRAVVTYYEPTEQVLFVQDASDGIFIDLSDNDDKGLPIRAGDLVEVTGVTAADFAPNVAETKIKVIGHTHFPVPKTGTFGSTEWGREDSRWIEQQGIVQSVVKWRAKDQAESLLTLGFSRFDAGC